MQTKHKVIAGVTAFVLILGAGFLYSQGSSFQGALTLREDRDRDGMKDIWEKQYGLNTTLNDGASDLDADGLSNRREFALMTNPTDTDSDDDGLTDGDEITYATQPLDSDSDDGTVSDGAEVTNGTDPLDGSDDVAVSGLPDLVGDEASTSFSISGEVFVSTDGIVWSYDVITTTTCGVLNDGSATASGPSYQDCDAYQTDDHSYTFGNPQTSSEDIDLDPGEVVAFDKSLSFEGTSAYVISFLQTLYDEGSIGVTIEYLIDNAANSRVITESDETNNEPSYTLTVDDSLITWTVEDEEDNADTTTTYDSAEIIDIGIEDIEDEESSSSTEEAVNVGSGSASRSVNQIKIARVNGNYQFSKM